MQCPSCGWENIPGSKQCCVCSTPITERPQGTNIRPPRARNRSFTQRVAWSVSTNPLVLRLSEGFYDRARRAVPSGSSWNPAAIGMLILSTVPGFSHIALLGQPLVGLGYLGTSLASLALAVLFYRSPACDLLLYSALYISVYGVVTAIEHIRGDDGSPRVRGLRRLGLTLMVASVYLSLYMGLRFAASPWIQVAGIGQVPEGSDLRRGDTILIRRQEQISRGDVVLVNAGENGMPVLSPVIGMPGDLVEMRERVYINGRRVGNRIEWPEWFDLGEQESAQMVLGKGQYWVRGNFVGHQGDTDLLKGLLQAGCVDREEIWGRAIAVTGPPSRRRIIREEENR